MSLLLALIAITIICVALAIVFASEKSGVGTMVCSVIALVVFSIVVFAGAPIELGYGYVSAKVEKFTKRLDAGVVYQVISSTKDDKNYVLLVKKAGASDFYTIRAEAVPPEHFTLIDGSPIAIAAPAVAVAPGK